MLRALIVITLLAAMPAPGDAQTRPEPAKVKQQTQAVQHGAQPNPQEVRPGSADGDSPSATVGTLKRDRPERKLLGLPVTAALVIGAVLVVLVALAGVIVPRARRRERAQGGGTYGRR